MQEDVTNHSPPALFLSFFLSGDQLVCINLSGWGSVTEALRAETAVSEHFLMSCVWACFSDGWPFCTGTAKSAHLSFLGARVYVYLAVTCHLHFYQNRVECTLNEESAWKDNSEKDYTAASSGDPTHDLLILSLVRYRWLSCIPNTVNIKKLFTSTLNIKKLFTTTVNIKKLFFSHTLTKIKNAATHVNKLSRQCICFLHAWFIHFDCWTLKKKLIECNVILWKFCVKSWLSLQTDRTRNTFWRMVGCLWWSSVYQGELWHGIESHCNELCVYV